MTKTSRALQDIIHLSPAVLDSYASRVWHAGLNTLCGDRIRSPDYSSGENLSYNHRSASPRSVLLCRDPHSANVTVIFVFLFIVTLILQMKADSKRGAVYIAVLTVIYISLSF